MFKGLIGAWQVNVVYTRRKMGQLLALQKSQLPLFIVHHGICGRGAKQGNASTAKFPMSLVNSVN